MTKDPIVKAWSAGFVRRWHTEPQLCDTVDYDSGHQQRCTVLLLSFWPKATRNEILNALVHDQGEIDAGDMARPVKQKYPEITTMLKDVEAESIVFQGFTLDPLTPEEMKRLSFIDLLDSYLWMLRHRPHMRFLPEWVAQGSLLHSWARDLNIVIKYTDFMVQFKKMYLGN